MATLGDLKTRIIEETDRDDLGSGEALENRLIGVIERAIEFHSAEAFWFTHDDAAATTTAGQAYITQPYAVRVAERVIYDGKDLQKVPLASIEGRTESGLPTQWASKGDRIQLWPIPDAAYALTVFGTAQLDAPEDDEDEGVWTNEAQDLIAARARFLLFRDVFRDVEGTQLAAQAEGEALYRLRRETTRRRVTPLRSTGGEPWAGQSTFNINRGC